MKWHLTLRSEHALARLISYLASDKNVLRTPHEGPVERLSSLKKVTSGEKHFKVTLYVHQCDNNHEDVIKYRSAFDALVEACGLPTHNQ